MILGAAGLVLLLAAGLATYYAISYAVLYVLGKAFPLAGRSRRRT
jgi:hypothetical protein